MTENHILECHSSENTNTYFNSTKSIIYINFMPKSYSTLYCTHVSALSVLELCMCKCIMNVCSFKHVFYPLCISLFPSFQLFLNLKTLNFSVKSNIIYIYTYKLFADLGIMWCLNWKGTYICILRASKWF